MDNQWKEEICGTCDFPTWYEETKDSEGRVRGICRKHPPNSNDNAYVNSYPTVLKSNPACSCWRERNDQ